MMKKFVYQALFLFSCIIADQNISQKSFVVVVPSFNNKDWYINNLDSIFSQKYSNFRIIYIDDCSEDGTADLVEEYIVHNGYSEKCTVIRNEQRYGPLYNRFRAIHSCLDDEIIVLVDGDDWLTHDGVLSYLNTIYSTEPVYMTVGNACKSSSGIKIGYRDYTQEEWEYMGIRQLGFRGVHPRTFYAWLFKKIKLEDLFEGEYLYSMATDVACLLPMFEMAQGHYKYIKDILYVYNDENPLNMARNGFQTQIYCDMMIRNRPSYARLTHANVGSSTAHKILDLGLLLFADKVQETSPFITECATTGLIFDKIIVVGHQGFNTDIFAPVAQSIQTLGLGCSLQTIYTLRINIRDRIKEAIEKIQSNYVVIMKQDCLDMPLIDFETVCAALENTQAYAIVLGKNGSEVVQSYYTYYKDPAYTISIARPWMFSQSFNSQDGCVGMIMRKDVLCAMLESATVFYPNFDTFVAAWYSLIPAKGVLLMNFFNN